jgi:hypothetical protein
MVFEMDATLDTTFVCPQRLSSLHPRPGAAVPLHGRAAGGNSVHAGSMSVWLEALPAAARLPLLQQAVLVYLQLHPLTM